MFLRQSIRARLLAADVAMFAEKKQHIIVNHGFRSNAVRGCSRSSGKGRSRHPGSLSTRQGWPLMSQLAG